MNTIQLQTSIFPLPHPAMIRFPLQARHQIGEGDNSKLEESFIDVSMVESPIIKETAHSYFDNIFQFLKTMYNKNKNFGHITIMFIFYIRLLCK